MYKVIKIYSKKTEFPTEDHWKVLEEKNCCTLIVADGVTRYLLRHATDKWGTPESKKAQLKEYPNPSPAKLTAEKFCKTSLNSLKKKKNIFETFKDANESILKFGFKFNPEPNLLENDYWGCVGAIARVENNNLSWGFICDCGVAVLTKKGKIKFKTLDEGTQTVSLMTKMFTPYLGKKVKDARTIEGRILLRGLFQNRLTYPRGDVKKGFGVINGDKNALDYVRTGSLELKDGETLLVYSDGLANVVTKKEFQDSIEKKNYKKIKEICDLHVDNEGTIIILTYFKTLKN